MTVRRHLCPSAAALLCLALALAEVARAGGLSSSVLAMFPKNVGEIGYADLKTARQAPWFPQFEAEVLPFRLSYFERYVTSAGMDLSKQVDEIAWAVAAPPAPPAAGAAASGGPPAAPQKFRGGEVVGIALGNFEPDQIDQYFIKQKLPTVTVLGYTLYAFGSGSSPSDLFFVFLDPNTVAFGHREPLEALIAVRFGEQESFLANDTLSSLVEEVNGQGTMWAALDKNYAQTAISSLLPDVAQFPGANKLLAGVKGMTITVQTDPAVDAQFKPQCGSSDDAQTLADLLQAGLLYKRYQAAQSNPDLARLIDATSVSSDGDHLKIRTQLPNDLLLALLQRNAFSLHM